MTWLWSTLAPWLVGAGIFFVCDVASYLAGRHLGARLSDWFGRRFPAAAASPIVRVPARLVHRHPVATLIVTQFTAVLRWIAPPLVGAARTPPLRALVAELVSLVLWVTAGVAATALWQDRTAHTVFRIVSWALLLIIAILIVVSLIRASGQVRSTLRLLAALPRRLPFTTGTVVLFLLGGVVTGALWSPAIHRPWFDTFAYGVPALADGHWWAPLTGSLFAAVPHGYGTFLLVAPVAIGILEHQRGTLRAAVIVIAGQLGAVLGASLIVVTLTATDWAWPNQLATTLDAGPAGGYLTALTVVAASLPSPWRLRARLGLTAVVVIPLLYVGSLTDLQHCIAVVLPALVAFGRSSRPPVRERRLLAFAAMLTLLVAHAMGALVGVNQIIDDELIPLWIDVAADVVLILLLATPLRRGVRVAWAATVLLALINVAEAIALAVVLGWSIADSVAAESILASGVLWALLAIFLLRERHAFTAPLRVGTANERSGPDGEALARVAVERFGGGSMSWMATWPDMRIQPVDNGVIAVQRWGKVRIAVGDPIVPADRMGDALERFAETASAEGLIPCVFAASSATRDVAPEHWRAVRVADDSVVTLPLPELRGKAWGDSRTAINRAAREGVSFRLTRLRDEPWSVVAQVRALCESWTDDKALPQMGFTLGTVREALDPEVRVALAETSGGRVEGVLSWLPVFAPGGAIHGWTLDLMRSRRGGFPLAVDFLITRSAQQLGEEGAAFVSLSGSPLATEPADPSDDEPAVGTLLERVAKLLEPVYGFRSLHNYKRKFQPRFDPLWLLYRDDAELAAIGLAIVRAYLPDASAADLVRAGFSLRG